MTTPTDKLPELPVICYVRAKDGKPQWSEDCVCDDPVYPTGDFDEDCTSMPLVRQSDALAALAKQAQEVVALREDAERRAEQMAFELIDEWLGLGASGAEFVKAGLAKARAARRNGGADCDHDWVDGQNEKVSGDIWVCTKCRSFQLGAKP